MFNIDLIDTHVSPVDVIISKYLRAKNTTNFIHVDGNKIEALLKMLKDLDDADPVDAKLAGTRYAEKAIFNVPSKELFDDIEKQVGSLLLFSNENSLFCYRSGRLWKPYLIRVT